jgi:hypothetical protein
MFSLITLTMLLETIVDGIMDYVQGLCNQHYMQLYNKMTTELMLLGIISFTIFMSEIAFGLQTKPYYIELEVAHLFLFFMGVILVAQSLTLLEYMRTFVHFWAKADVKSTEELSRLCKLADSMPFWQRVKLREELRFHIIKHEFITNKMLPKDFAFVSYLDKSLVGMVCHGVHIDYRYWAAICVLIWINYLRTELVSSGTTSHDGAHRRLAGGGLVPDPGPFPEWGMWVFVGLGYMLLTYGLAIYYWTGPVVVDQFTKEALRHVKQTNLEGGRGSVVDGKWTDGGDKQHGDCSFYAFGRALQRIDADHTMYTSLQDMQQDMQQKQQQRQDVALATNKAGFLRSAPGPRLDSIRAGILDEDEDEDHENHEEDEVKLLPPLVGPSHTPEVRRALKRQPSVLIVERYEGARKVHMASRHINNRESLVQNTSMARGGAKKWSDSKSASRVTGGLKKVSSRAAMGVAASHAVLQEAKKVGISHAIQVHLHSNRMERVAVFHQMLLLFNIFYTVAFLTFYLGIMPYHLIILCLAPILLLWFVVIPLASKSTFFLQAVAMHNEEILGEVKLEELDVLNGIDMMAKHIENYCGEVASAVVAEEAEKAGISWAAGQIQPLGLRELFVEWTALPSNERQLQAKHAPNLRTRLNKQFSFAPKESSERGSVRGRARSGTLGMGDMFSASFDTNETSLNVYKLKLALASIGLVVDHTRVNLIFIGLDDDRDGLIQMDEFLEKVLPHCSQRFQKRNSQDATSWSSPSITPSGAFSKIQAIRRGLSKGGESVVKSARTSLQKSHSDRKSGESSPTDRTKGGITPKIGKTVV